MLFTFSFYNTKATLMLSQWLSLWVAADSAVFHAAGAINRGVV